MAELERLRRPQIEEVGGRTYINVPILGDDKSLGPDYVIAFAITKKGPSREGKVVYCAPDLFNPPPFIIKRAWYQAYAVWKTVEEKASLPV